MEEQKDFAVIQLSELKWPTSPTPPCSRFRLFVAADTSDVSASAITDFATAALDRGMVYVCTWGRNCERFHDIVDEVVAQDEVGERKFVGPTAKDVVITTWHENETLEEALEFFTNSALPTEGFLADSNFRFVICVGNPDWSRTASRVLQAARYFG